jgi:hypothetical protein
MCVSVAPRYERGGGDSRHIYWYVMGQHAAPGALNACLHRPQGGGGGPCRGLVRGCCPRALGVGVGVGGSQHMHSTNC